METIQLTTEQSQELITLAEDLNEKLRSAASSSAERAFGIGCSIGLIPVIAVAVVLYAMRVINLILAVLVSIMAVLFLVGTASLLSSVARANSLKRTYQREVEPGINQFIAQQGMPRRQFDTIASQALPEEAPLQVFLSPLPPEQSQEPVAVEIQVEK